jgi:cell division protease FtsH
MVKEFGVSDRLGPVAYGRKHQMSFLGRDIGEQRNFLERVGQLIDEEIQRFLAEGLARATAILRAHPDVLDRVARELIGRESLDALELEYGYSAASARLRQRPPERRPRLAARAIVTMVPLAGETGAFAEGKI